MLPPPATLPVSTVSAGSDAGWWHVTHAHTHTHTHTHTFPFISFPTPLQFVSLVQLHPVIAVAGPSCSGKTQCIQCGAEVMRGLCGAVSCVTLATEAMREEQLMGYQLSGEKYSFVTIYGCSYYHWLLLLLLAKCGIHSYTYLA